ncbi:MAG: glycosyltransferase family 4 protein [Bacteroidota bacterium]
MHNYKILLITHQFYPYVGGIEVNSEILAYEFEKLGCEVSILTWTKEKGNKKHPYRIIRMPSIKQLLREHRNADIVFENNPTLRLSWPQFFLKKPHVVAVRTWIKRVDGSISWQDKLKRKWLKRASKTIAISQAIKADSNPEAEVIGNPYRNELFFRRKEIAKTNNFVYLGRLVSDKGVDLAIEALAALNNQVPEQISFNLTIIGDGEERIKLEKRVNELGLKKQVRFTGILKGELLARELNQHQYLIAPSRWDEPFGNVALEGMACGCIPIVSSGGGLPDAVGEAGLVFDSGDIDSLVHCMKTLVEDEKMKQQLLRNTSSHLTQHLASNVAKRYYNVLLEAIK